MDLLLHKKTRNEVQAFLDNPSQPLLIVGKPGSGKKYLSKYLASKILQVDEQELSQHPYVLTLAPVKNSVGIEQVRQVQTFIKLKTTGTSNVRRVIIVCDAHKMTPEAQNSFLKILEEPPVDTVIILTASSRDEMLPTIVSRSEVLFVLAPTKDQIKQYFSSYPEAEITKAFYLSGGRVGLLYRLLNPDQNADQLSLIEIAKQVYQSPAFDRLVLADKLSKQKIVLGDFLWAMQSIARSGLTQAAHKNDLAMTRYWQSAIKAILEAQNSLTANPQSKLLLTNLFLHL